VGLRCSVEGLTQMQEVIQNILNNAHDLM
jgi:hypothetical protein